MFVKQKQPSEKTNSDKFGKNASESQKGNNVFEDIKETSIGNIMPPKVKSPPSLLSTDLFIKGNLSTSGDIQIEGSVEGNIKASLLTIGQSALIKGEISADEVVVNGNISGTIRGERVHLTSSAHVEGDIIHGSIAIESGAHFEGTIEKSEDPFNKPKPKISAVVS
jgi:cytoskeletal protein CcmA (bactofilin family)